MSTAKPEEEAQHEDKEHKQKEQQQSQQLQQEEKEKTGHGKCWSLFYSYMYNGLLKHWHKVTTCS